MMVHTAVAPRDGLGLVEWLIPLIATVGGTIGAAVVTKAIAGPSSPSQKEIEAQLKAQAQAEIQRMAAEAQFREQQTKQLGQYLVPALGVLAVVMLLR